MGGELGSPMQKQGDWNLPKCHPSRTGLQEKAFSSFDMEFAKFFYSKGETA